MIKITLIGDISLNDIYTDLSETELQDCLSVELQNELYRSDILITNLESPILTDQGVNLLKFPRLSTTEKALSLLKTIRPNIVILANNHIYDCLENGFNATKEALKRLNIETVGAGTSIDDARKPRIMEHNGYKIGLLAYVASDTNPSIPQDAKVYINYLEPERCFYETRELAKENDIVIVSLHWGEELSSFPSYTQRSFARALIDNGAHIVYGHHCHCLQGHEQWKHGHIFYNLGNFIFGNLDSLPTRPLIWSKNSRKGLIAQCEFEHGRINNIISHYTYQRGLRVEFDHGKDRIRDMVKLCQPLSYSDQKYLYFSRALTFYEDIIRSSFNKFFGEGRSWQTELRNLSKEDWHKLIKLSKLFYHNFKGGSIRY